MLPRICRSLLAAGLLFPLAAGAVRSAEDGPQALKAARKCEDEADISACQRALRLGLSPKLASEVYTFWADALLPSMNAYDPEAAKLLQKAIVLDPENALAMYVLASHMYSGNYKLFEEKRRIFHKAAELRPDWEGPHEQLAMLAKPWQFEEMIAEWSKAVELAPDDPIYRKELESARKAREAASAKLRAMEEKAKADPKMWSVHAVEAAKWVCDIPKAEEYAAIMEKYQPYGAGRSLADAYSGCAQFGKAIELYRKIIDSLEKRLDSGLTVIEALQVPEQSLQFLDLKPELMRLYLVQAAAAERSESWWEAHVALDRAAQLTPSADLYARLARATLKANGGDKGAAMQALAKGLKLDPKLLEKYPELKPYAPEEKKK